MIQLVHIAPYYRYGELPPASTMLRELLRTAEVQELFEACYGLLNIPLSIIDLKANVLFSSRWRRICTQFHRVHPLTCRGCVGSDTTLSRQLREGESCAVYECANGLVDCASPIVINDKHVANVFVGQFLTREPDQAWFRKRAEECGFDADEYLAALREVPVVDPSSIPKVVSLLTHITRVITNLSIEKNWVVGARVRRQVILDAIPQAVFWKDPDGRYLGCNAAFARSAGLGRPEDIVGRTDFELAWPRAQAEAFRADDEAVIAANQPRLHAIEPIQQADGSRIIADTSRIPVAGTGTGDNYLVGIYEDVTEHKRAEDRIAASEARFRALYEQAAVGIKQVDADGRLLLVNPALSYMLGYGVDELIGKKTVEITDRESAGLEIPLVRSLVAGERDVYSLDKRYMRRDGSRVWVNVVSSAVRGRDNRFLYRISIVNDISERKKAEEEVERLACRLITAHEEERIRIAREIHDNFGQTVALLTIQQEKLRQRLPDDLIEERKQLSIMAEQFHSLSAGLRGLSHRLHSGTLDHLGLAAALEDLCEELSGAHGIPVQFVDHGLPTAMDSDVARCLFRVAQQALANAMAHSGASRVDMETMEGPHAVVMRIADNGWGFDASAAHDGIGLVTMRERVRLVGGTLAVESGIRLGTRITVEIPHDRATRLRE
jgi:PAS domain S-box-containing protein